MGLWHFVFRLGLDLKVALSAPTITNSTSFTKKWQQHQPWVPMSEHNNPKRLEHRGYSRQRERSQLRACPTIASVFPGGVGNVKKPHWKISGSCLCVSSVEDKDTAACWMRVETQIFASSWLLIAEVHAAHTQLLILPLLGGGEGCVTPPRSAFLQQLVRVDAIHRKSFTFELGVL